LSKALRDGGIKDTLGEGDLIDDYLLKLKSKVCVVEN
jgi:hypothetical protein